MAKKFLKKAQNGASTKFKPGQVSATRAYQLSDSLKKEASRYEGAASSARQTFLKSGSKSDLDNFRNWSNVSSSNKEKSERLKSRADSAMSAASKKKMGGKVMKKK